MDKDVDENVFIIWHVVFADNYIIVDFCGEMFGFPTGCANFNVIYYDTVKFFDE